MAVTSFPSVVWVTERTSTLGDENVWELSTWRCACDFAAASPVPRGSCRGGATDGETPGAIKGLLRARYTALLVKRSAASRLHATSGSRLLGSMNITAATTSIGSSVGRFSSGRSMTTSTEGGGRLSSFLNRFEPPQFLLEEARV